MFQKRMPFGQVTSDLRLGLRGRSAHLRFSTGFYDGFNFSFRGHRSRDLLGIAPAINVVSQNDPKLQPAFNLEFHGNGLRKSALSPAGFGNH